jgi:membrane associated rhomboid family serine protease
MTNVNSMQPDRKHNIWDSFKTVLAVVALLWAILLTGYVIPLSEYGILPRTVRGLVGIVTAPFIHAGFDHLVTNSISLLILGSIFLTMEKKLSAVIMLHFIVLSGFGTWLIGRSEYTHIGASGVIYAILGYLLTMGIFTRNFRAIIVSILVFILYGGAIWGIFPTPGFISWESHLCGFLAGIVTAKMYASRNRRRYA